VCLQHCLAYVSYMAESGSECSDFNHKCAILPNSIVGTKSVCP
jgi:hypothetical protein